MKHTLFLLGPSDMDSGNPTLPAWVEDRGWKITADFSGVLPIMPFIESDETLSANSQTVLVGLQNIRLRRGARVNLFNLVGDPDASGRLLDHIDKLAGEIKPERYFNRVSAVRSTSRARLPETLADIPGCLTPAATAADPATREELLAACRAFGHWPLIVRSRGRHGGGQMLLLQDESALQSLEPHAWLFEGIFLIQYIDYRTEDGLFRKLRVVMVDGVPYVRQCVFSDRWAIHAGSRADLMDDDDDLCRREETFLAQLRDEGLQQHARIFRAIQERIGLDVFGIDFALINDQLVIFEANACMRFLGRDDRPNTRYGYNDVHKQALRLAIKTMLVDA